MWKTEVINTYTHLQLAEKSIIFIAFEKEKFHRW